MKTPNTWLYLSRWGVLSDKIYRFILEFPYPSRTIQGDILDYSRDRQHGDSENMKSPLKVTMLIFFFFLLSKEITSLLKGSIILDLKWKNENRRMGYKESVKTWEKPLKRYVSCLTMQEKGIRAHDQCDIHTRMHGSSDALHCVNLDFHFIPQFWSSEDCFQKYSYTLQKSPVKVKK